jgi:hypothetical protein
VSPRATLPIAPVAVVVATRAVAPFAIGYICFTSSTQWAISRTSVGISTSWPPMPSPATQSQPMTVQSGATGVNVMAPASVHVCQLLFPFVAVRPYSA